MKKRTFFRNMDMFYINLLTLQVNILTPRYTEFIHKHTFIILYEYMNINHTTVMW